MKKLLALLFLSLAIASQASDTYIYTSGLDSAIQHWQYPSTTAMNTDFGFFAQDVGKIAFNKGDGIYYYLADTTPTWIPLATGGGGGSTTFLGLIDTPDVYTGQGGKLVAVNSGATALEFVTAAGGGNVSNVGTPAADETAVWTDPTHIKGVRTLSGGSSTYVLTKLSATDYDYGWSASTGGGSTVSITATSPILVTPSPVTGTGVISLDPASDLAALEALTGANTIYYRSGTNAWSPVVIGSNLTFSAGTLAASTGGSGTNAFGTISVSGQSDVVAETAPDTLTLVAGTNVTITTNPLTDTVTIASSGGAGGVTSLSATSPIQVSPNPITSTGTVSLESGSDLAAVEALTGTNTIYYRSGVSAWSPVTMGSNMTFTAGALAAGNSNWDTGYSERRQWDGGATNLNATIGRSNLGATTIGANVFTLGNPPSTSWLKLTSVGGVVAEDAATTKSSLGLNISNWDTAYADRMKWDTSLGISGGTAGQGRTALGATTAGGNFFILANPGANSWPKVSSAGAVTLEDAATTKTSLTLTKSDVGLGSVTNDVQTKAAIMPNTAPTSGQVPVGNGTAYVPGTIPNTSLTNSSITIGLAGATSLGGTATADNIIGIGGAGSTPGIVKRYGVNNFGYALAGTDYKAGGQDAINVRFITATGTFTCSAGVTALFVEGVGGGGGGGGVQVSGTNVAGYGGGGGGGGYAAVYISSPAASYSVTIGAGGVAGSSSGGDGTDGGSTIFGTVLTTGGGGGGTGMTGGGVVAEVVVNAYNGAGGTATVGTMLIPGGEGTAIMVMGASGTTVWGVSGGGGASVWGMGGQGRGGHSASGGGVTGVPGTKYGGGGSGAASGATAGGRGGGFGAIGLIKVTEIF